VGEVVGTPRIAVPCFECGAPSESDHHVVPRSPGGTRTVPLCGDCHGKAHHRDGRMTSRELTRAALAAKIARRERVGSVRFGDDLAADGRRVGANDAERSAIARMAAWRASGASYREICRRLDAEGVATKEGGSWRPATVRRILLRTAAPAPAPGPGGQ
jgi:hypothetical protein